MFAREDQSTYCQALSGRCVVKYLNNYRRLLNEVTQFRWKRKPPEAWSPDSGRLFPEDSCEEPNCRKILSNRTFLTNLRQFEMSSNEGVDSASWKIFQTSKDSTQ